MTWSWLPVALLVAALAILVAAEWPRLQRVTGVQVHAERGRKRRKAKLRLLKGGSGGDDPDEFAASVERDLAKLPTIEERDHH